MRRNSRTIQVLSVLAMLACSANRLSANGFRLPDQDAFATARGEAFVATANNPSAIYYNPSGITQLQGHSIRLGAYGVSLNPTYHSPMGGSFDNESELHAVPQFFYSYVPEKFPLSFGLGLYAPFGLGVKWPQDTGFRTIATEGSLSYMTLSPVVAWKILPNLSIAAGPTFNYSDTDLRQGIFPPPGKDQFRFKGDATDFGYIVGARWEPISKVALGVTYHSQTTMDYDGHTEAVPLYQSMPASARLPFPQILVMGVSYRPTPLWNIEFNAEYDDWSRLDTLAIKQSFQVAPMILNWRSSWLYEFGVTRYLNNGWRVSAGYVFNENSVPDASYNPLVSDMDRHFFSVGVGYQGKHFSFDVCYQLGYGPSRTVSGSALSAAGQSADGKYEFLSHALSASLGWRF